MQSGVYQVYFELLGKYGDPVKFWPQWCAGKKLSKGKPNLIRSKLLALYGIGPETAETILLYVLDKPSFVIEEYTRRFVIKNNWSKKLAYHHLKKFFERNLPKNRFFQKYHANYYWPKGEKASLRQAI